MVGKASEGSLKSTAETAGTNITDFFADVLREMMTEAAKLHYIKFGNVAKFHLS